MAPDALTWQVVVLYLCWWFFLFEVIHCTSVPDEQRLYQDLMLGYEKSVRPVINSSTILQVTLGLKLNQIVDLDERHQVLTTNVFIDQEWRDENLLWNPIEYNNIRSLRIPAKQVWLPDTFIYNNADDGSTGFMQGTYVLVNHNGTVLWPVPVKLKSSCKVDITYFPFDDQECILRFGSWIYSGLWMDYQSLNNDTPVDLTSYVNNSEWDLLSVSLRRNVRKHSCCDDPHPDMTYVFHIRRKTFYYIFNIIVPCVMLSVLTLLTFWLPPTSGEKITLGLSVFLAFSMFMLLIAEEVPATSEAVPLIGIYLCVVMTMTSLSVIMAVMVINLYNRGLKTRRAPAWLRAITLRWISKPLLMKHDIEKVANTISLEDEKEGAYRCKKHDKKQKLNNLHDVNTNDEYRPTVRNRRFTNNSIDKPIKTNDSEEEEVIWLRREDFVPETSEIDADVTMASNNFNLKESQNNNKVKQTCTHSENRDSKTCAEQIEKEISEVCKTQINLKNRKLIVAEWQRIAAVVDRILFWFYFLGTLASYILILVVVPDEQYEMWNKQIREYRINKQDPYVS